MIQNHIDHLSGKVHAVPTRQRSFTTCAAVQATVSRTYSWWDHDSKFASEVFRAYVKGWGSCLIVGSAYHKNTNANVERANGIVSDTLRTFANGLRGRKDDWDDHLPSPCSPSTLIQQRGVDAARRRPGAFLRRPRRTLAPSAPPVTTSRRPRRVPAGESLANHA
jgi:hypothetical protein